MRIFRTAYFDKWFKNLKDVSAKAKISARLRRIEIHESLIGDYKLVGESIIELRFDCGPGYRVYLARKDDTLLLLLVGGDKSSQKADIEKAKRLAKEWRYSNDNQN